MSDLLFDAAETELMFNPEVFLLKRRLNGKIYILFEHLKTRLKDTEEHKQFSFPHNADTATGKISQGENYQSCPWVMLDFPRLFTKTEIFAFRTLFWYGHYFSGSLLCSGEIAKEKIQNLIRNRQLLLNKEIFFCLFPDPWLHDIDSRDYKRIDELTDAQMKKHVSETGYFKLGSKFISQQPEDIIQNIEKLYKLFLEAVS